MLSQDGKLSGDGPEGKRPTFDIRLVTTGSESSTSSTRDSNRSSKDEGVLHSFPDEDSLRVARGLPAPTDETRDREPTKVRFKDTFPEEGLVITKVWGSTMLVGRTTHTETYEISVKKGSYSSNHIHKDKANLFWVQKGRLFIILYGKSPSLIEIPALSAFWVNPGVEHRFFAPEDTTALEVYMTPPSKKIKWNDIERLDEGGVLCPPEDYSTLLMNRAMNV